MMVRAGSDECQALWAATQALLSAHTQCTYNLPNQALTAQAIRGILPVTLLIPSAILN